MLQLRGEVEIRRIVLKRVALLFVTVLLCLPTAVLAAEEGAGVIEGQLLNGTEGGGSTAAQTVTLTTYLNDKESATASATSDAAGKFVFKGLSISPGHAYEPKVRYQDADYSGGKIILSANETSKIISLKVYDSTTSDAALKVSIAHTIMTPVDGGLQVMEFLVFTNNSNLTYIGFSDASGARKTIRLPLPDEATDIQIGGDLQSLSQDQNGFFDVSPVFPGEKTLLFSYRIANSSNSYTFVRKVDYPMSAYNVLVKGEKAGISADGLTSGGPVDLNGEVYNSLSGGNLARGTTLEVRLTNLSGGGGQNIIVWVLIAVVVLGAAGGFAIMMKKKNIALTVGESSPDEMRRQLLLDIAQMDDDFEAGTLDKETYTKLRAEKKSQLVEFMKDSDAENRGD